MVTSAVRISSLLPLSIDDVSTVGSYNYDALTAKGEGSLVLPGRGVGEGLVKVDAIPVYCGIASQYIIANISPLPSSLFTAENITSLSLARRQKVTND